MRSPNQLLKNASRKQHAAQRFLNDTPSAREKLKSLQSPKRESSTSWLSFFWRLEFLLSPVTEPGVLAFLEFSLVGCQGLAFAAVVFAVRFFRKKPNPTYAVLLINRALTLRDSIQESVPRQCGNRAHGVAPVWGRLGWHVLELEERWHST